MDMKLRNMTTTEHRYGYTQSQQLMGQTGCIGHLRADMDTNGKGFFTTWDDHFSHFGSPEFREEFNQVIGELRKGNGILSNRDNLTKYCYGNPDSKQDDHYGVRVDTQEHTYMVRLNPNRGEYNAYVYCYVREWLDSHQEQATKGIRFIDTQYNDFFHIHDGGMIAITDSAGKVHQWSCRYIDDHHMEMGNNLYHIHEFALRMAENGNTVAPVQDAGLWTPQQVTAISKENLENKVAILKPTILKGQYQTPDHQLVLVTHGPGCTPGGFSDTIHLTSLKDGDRMVCGRCDLMGIPKPEFLPPWAQKQVAELEKSRSSVLEKLTTTKEPQKKTPTKQKNKER